MAEKKKQSVLDKTQKKIVMPLVVAIIFVIALGYLWNYCSNLLSTTKAQLAHAKRMETAIRRMQELKIKEDELLKVFPNVNKRSDIIEEIAGWARKEGMEITQIEPKESSLSDTNFRKLELTLNGKGNYIPVTRFLKRVESSPYFILASGLDLEGHQLQGQTRSRYTRRGLKDQNDTAKQFSVTVHVFLLQ